MYISQMTIENYRTFRHVEMRFDREMNYIVGDNNIGKSNFLCLLKWMTHGYGFKESDFFDTDAPIEVHMTLEGESGEALHLKLLQHVQEISPRLFDQDSGEALPLEYMRCLFYIDFGLLEALRRRLTDQSVKEMLGLLSSYFGEPEAAVEMEALLKRQGISLPLSGKSADQAAMDFFRELFGKAGGHRHQAMRLMMAVGLMLLSEMVEKKRSKAISFDQMIVTDGKGRRFLNLLLSVDEPELHLNPYLQRSILAFCHSILSNRDPLFLKLVQKFLGVDGLSGQLFVVTHSTDALVNDYRRIIRMYWDEKAMVQAACGAAFQFDVEIEKHLIMHFPEVKEALYARAAILVEGETEYGSFAGFARTLGVHLDYHGICLINARGESSISKIAKLLRRYHIPAISLYDRDVMGTHKKQEGIYYTDYICYEMDVVKACLAARRRDLLDTLIGQMDGSGMVGSALIKKAGAKLAIPKGHYPPRKLKNINPRDQGALEFYYFAWLYGNKGVIIGRALASLLSEKEIPPAFAKVIRAAEKVSSR